MAKYASVLFKSLFATLPEKQRQLTNWDLVSSHSWGIISGPERTQGTDTRWIFLECTEIWFPVHRRRDTLHIWEENWFQESSMSTDITLKATNIAFFPIFKFYLNLHFSALPISPFIHSVKVQRLDDFSMDIEATLLKNAWCLLIWYLQEEEKTS